MKKTTIILIAMVSLLFIHCRKEYVCECFNPSAVFKTYTIKATKRKATQKCADYSKEYQGTGWSETGCMLK